VTDTKPFFDALRKTLVHSFSQGQVDGFNTFLAMWWRLFPAAPLEYIAYALATAWHETASTMQPIREYGRGHGRKYGVPTGKWGQIYYGRGYVQLTWEANYAKADAELHKRGILKPEESLLKNPELALRPDVAAAVMIYGMFEGWFTGKKLADYFAKGHNDPVNARRMINGTDKAAVIAGYYQHFLAAIKLIAAPPLATEPRKQPLPPAAPPVVEVNDWVEVGQLAQKISGHTLILSTMLVIKPRA
jgi:hypothetical protein